MLRLQVTSSVSLWHSKPHSYSLHFRALIVMWCIPTLPLEGNFPGSWELHQRILWPRRSIWKVNKRQCINWGHWNAVPTWKLYENQNNHLWYDEAAIIFLSLHCTFQSYWRRIGRPAHEIKSIVFYLKRMWLPLLPVDPKMRHIHLYPFVDWIPCFEFVVGNARKYYYVNCFPLCWNDWLAWPMNWMRTRVSVCFPRVTNFSHGPTERHHVWPSPNSILSQHPRQQKRRRLVVVFVASFW
jgi:hypothetical protein